MENLPDSWVLCCFGDVCNYGECDSVSVENIPEEAWVLDLEDIEKGSGRVMCRVSKRERSSMSMKHRFCCGQVLYSKLRPYLNKVVLADANGYCTSEILPLEFIDIYPPYARYYLMSPTFLQYADRCSYGVKMPRLGTSEGRSAVFPLPPVNEQLRISNMVDAMLNALSEIDESLK